MGWKAAEMRKFIVNHLGPALAAAKLDPRVVMLDDNKAMVSSWAKEVRMPLKDNNYLCTRNCLLIFNKNKVATKQLP